MTEDNYPKLTEDMLAENIYNVVEMEIQKTIDGNPDKAILTRKIFCSICETMAAHGYILHKL